MFPSYTRMPSYCIPLDTSCFGPFILMNLLAARCNILNSLYYSSLVHGHMCPSSQCTSMFTMQSTSFKVWTEPVMQHPRRRDWTIKLDQSRCGMCGSPEKSSQWARHPLSDPGRSILYTQFLETSTCNCVAVHISPPYLFLCHISVWLQRQHLHFFFLLQTQIRSHVRRRHGNKLPYPLLTAGSATKLLPAEELKRHVHLWDTATLKVLILTALISAVRAHEPLNQALSNLRSQFCARNRNHFPSP